MNDKISIILTERRRLSCVRLVLGGLLRNSHFKHHEIVFVGDRIWMPCEGNFEVEDYNTVEQYLNDYWISKMENAGFKFNLITGNWSREELDDPDRVRTPCYECWSHGAEKAVNNLVLIIGSDDYMSPNWDSNITKRFDEYDPCKHAFQPVFAFICRPPDDPTIPEGDRADDHAGHIGWKALYKYYVDKENVPLKESEVYEHWNTHKKDGVFIEAGGKRQEIGYWATVVHKDVIKRIAELNVNHQIFNWRRLPNEGEFHEGLDLDFDNKLSKIKVPKVGCLDSFFYNLKNYRESLNRGRKCFLFDMGDL